MTSSITAFRGYLSQFNDIAKADRFTVMIIPPPALVAAYGYAAQGLSFQCDGAELPGRTIETVFARTYGPTYQYPSGTTYDDFTLNFICMANRNAAPTTGLWEKRFFEDWLNLINPSGDSNSWNVAYRDDICTTINITHYDQADQESYSVNMLKAWPKAVTTMQLNWNDDSVLRLTVPFIYTRWERSGVASVSIIPSGTNSDTTETTTGPASDTSVNDAANFDPSLFSSY